MSAFEPAIVYRVPGLHFGPEGKTYDYKGVQSEAELQDAIANGWHVTMLDALHPPVVEEIADNQPPTRAELEEKAKELGIRFDGRTSDAKLAANIEAALNGLDKA
jgi:hypothetical protein